MSSWHILAPALSPRADKQCARKGCSTPKQGITSRSSPHSLVVSTAKLGRVAVHLYCGAEKLEEVGSSGSSSPILGQQQQIDCRRAGKRPRQVFHLQNYPYIDHRRECRSTGDLSALDLRIITPGTWHLGLKPYQTRVCLCAWSRYLLQVAFPHKISGSSRVKRHTTVLGTSAFRDPRLPGNMVVVSMASTVCILSLNLRVGSGPEPADLVHKSYRNTTVSSLSKTDSW